MTIFRALVRRRALVRSADIARHKQTVNQSHFPGVGKVTVAEQKAVLFLAHLLKDRRLKKREKLVGVATFDELNRTFLFELVDLTHFVDSAQRSDAR